MSRAGCNGECIIYIYQEPFIFKKRFWRESQRSSHILSPKATPRLQHDAISRINDMQDSVQERTALLIYAAEQEDTVLIYASKASKDSSSRYGEQTKGTIQREREWKTNARGHPWKNRKGSQMCPSCGRAGAIFWFMELRGMGGEFMNTRATLAYIRKICERMYTRGKNKVNCRTDTCVRERTYALWEK